MDFKGDINWIRAYQILNMVSDLIKKVEADFRAVKLYFNSEFDIDYYKKLFNKYKFKVKPEYTDIINILVYHENNIFYFQTRIKADDNWRDFKIKFTKEQIKDILFKLYYDGAIAEA